MSYVHLMALTPVQSTNDFAKKPITKMSKEQNEPQLKRLKLFGGNKLPKNWIVEKAVAQMDKVSKHSCSLEEAMRALEFSQTGSPVRSNPC